MKECGCFMFMSILRGCSFIAGALGARIFHLLFCCLTSDMHLFLKRYCEGNGLRLIWPPRHTDKPPPKKKQPPTSIIQRCHVDMETFSTCCKALLRGYIWAPRTPEFFSQIWAGQRKASLFLKDAPIDHLLMSAFIEGEAAKFAR